MAADNGGFKGRKASQSLSVAFLSPSRGEQCSCRVGCVTKPFGCATNLRLHVGAALYTVSPPSSSPFPDSRRSGALSAATEQDKRFSRDQTKRTNGTDERMEGERGIGSGERTNERTSEGTDPTPPPHPPLKMVGAAAAIGLVSLATSKRHASSKRHAAKEINLWRHL